MRFPQTPSARLIVRLLSTILILSCASSLSAQTAAPSAATLAKYDLNKNGRLDANEMAAMEADERSVAPVSSDRNSASGEVMELSPFQVKAEQDGYYAKNTTSSTRLNSSLDDLASSTSIVTKEQMADFAMLDINDIFAYEVGTEGSGTFTDAAVDRNGSTIDTVSNDPNNANRVRGVGSANIARGNFASNGRVPVDPIDIDGVEISRGPNSSIFGLGEVSGTVNLQPATANISRDRSSIGLRTDDRGGWRTSIDLNRVIIKNKLAIRGSAVYQRDAFERKPSGIDSVRLNGMIRYKPFQNTSITGSFSRFRSFGTLPNQIMPRETISAWRAAGSPTWDPVTATVKKNGVVVPGTWNTTNLPASLNASQSLTLSTVFVQPDGNVSWWGPSRTTSLATPVTAANQNVFLVTTVPVAPTPAQPLFATDPATNGAGIYDYESINLYAMNYTAVRQSTSVVQLEQTFFNTPRQLLAFQGGYFRENGVRQVDNIGGSAGSGGRTGYINIDVNERMVDGSPNPNFLRPFIGVYNIRAKSDNYSRRDTGRAQLAYRLDLRQETNFLRWLGMHTLSGYAEYREIGTRLTRWQDELSDSQPWRVFPTTPTTITNFTTPAIAAQPYYRFYVGDNQGQDVDYAPHALNPGSYPFVWGNGVTGVFNRSPALLRSNYYAPNVTGWTKNILKTQGAALQSFLLKDRIVTTIGLRKDHTWDRSPAPRQYIFDTNGYTLIPASLDVLSTADATERNGSTKTAGIVIKATSWLRFHANKSDSFLPASLAQVGLFRNLLPNPTGEGEDYGVSVTLFGGKLNARLNRYSTLQVQSRSNNGGTLAQRVQGIDLTTNYAPPGLVNLARGWITRAAAANGETLTTEELNRRISSVTKLDEAYWTDAQANSLVYAPSDVESKGYEFELNYNPSRFWTMKFNVTEMVSIDKNLSKDINNWIALRRPVWESIIDPELGVPFFTERYGAAVSAKEFLEASVLAPVAVAQANEGKSLPQVRKYRANFLTRYQLAGISDNRWLKKTSVGGAVRWEDKGAIGYYGVADSAGVYTSLDANRPIYDSSHAYFDLFATYRTKLYKNKVNATFQLNVKNVQESGRLQTVSALPDGTPAAYRIVDPRQFILSVTFDL